jgi:hypothetical protein
MQFIRRRARQYESASLPCMVALGVLVLSLAGCAAVIRVEHDEHDQVAGLRYWTWLPGATEHVNAAHRDAFDLELHMAEYVERALEARGYRQDAKRLDFFVDYALVLATREETIIVGDGATYLASNSFSASYVVEKTRPVQRRLEDTYVVLRLWSRDGRLLWQGGLSASQELAALPDLERHLGDLADRLPGPAMAAPAASRGSSYVSTGP